MSTSPARQRRLMEVKELPQMVCVSCGVPLDRVFSPRLHLKRHVIAAGYDIASIDPVSTGMRSQAATAGAARPTPASPRSELA
jgi:hypothetical protein